MLRNLEMIFAGRGITRAFADDTAAVIEDLFGFMPRVAKVFDEYAAVSGLFLNYEKNMIAPLWRQVEARYDDIDKELARIGGEWEYVQVKTVAKYLGFLVGLGVTKMFGVRLPQSGSSGPEN